MVNEATGLEDTISDAVVWALPSVAFTVWVPMVED